MRYFSPASLFAAALGCAALVAPYAANVTGTLQEYHVEVRLAASTAADGALRVDSGSGIADRPVSQAQILATASPETYRFPLPPGNYRALQLTLDPAGTRISMSSARVVDRAGHTRRELEPTATNAAGTATFVLDRELHLAPPWGRLVGGSIAGALVLFLLAGGALFALERCDHRALRARLATCPQHVTLFVAAAAAIASCYPVVFFGRSFVSPNYTYGTPLLYPRHPTLPGHDAWRTEYEKTSDTSALMWQHVPYARLQHEALFRDGELPLWNRYNSAGAVLLAQGQSMFGNPLQFLVVLADSPAWAWDALFVLMKALFAAGLGLIVWEATRHHGATLFTAAIAPFIGFFVHRLNHPAIFSLCFAPWMLWCWLRIAHAPDGRAAARWTFALVVANWCELTSGTAKEAYMLLVALNLTGVLVLAFTALPAREKLRRLAITAAGGVLFAAAAAPVWATFRDALNVAYTMYNQPAAQQLPPQMLLGLFDEIFLRPLDGMRRVIGPSANFVVLFGVLYAVATLRRSPRDRLPIALLIGAALPAALVFGVVPAAWIVRVPILGNVTHIDNTFSCVLIVHLFALAGCGFAAAARRLAPREGTADVLIAGGMLTVLVGVWAFHAQTDESLRASGFVWDALWLQLFAGAAFVWCVRRILQKRVRSFAMPLCAAICVGPLLWRHGQHLDAVLPDYVFNPPERAALYTSSPALDWIHANQTAPARVIGLDTALPPGWHDVYHIEGITGPDAVVNARYRELLLAGGVELIWDWRFMVPRAALANQQRMFDFLNVAHYLDYGGDRTQPPGALQLVHQADFDVYRSASVWPRAFFSDRVAHYTTPEDLVALLRTSDGRPFVAVQADTPMPVAMPADALDHRHVSPATDYVLTANTTSFVVDAPGAGIVALHEAWSDGEILVTINGREAPAFRVNHAFRGVAVDAAGRYEISFRYRPRHLTSRLVMAAIAGGVLIVGVVLTLRPRARPRQEGPAMR